MLYRVSTPCRVWPFRGVPFISAKTFANRAGTVFRCDVALNSVTGIMEADSMELMRKTVLVTGDW